MPPQVQDGTLSHALVVAGVVCAGLVAGIVPALVGAFFLRMASKRALTNLGYWRAVVTTYLAFVASFGANLVLGFGLESAGVVVQGQMPDELIMQAVFAVLGVLIYACLIWRRHGVAIGQSILMALITSVLVFLALMLCAIAITLLAGIFAVVT